jgi:hypothetical protein
VIEVDVHAGNREIVIIVLRLRQPAREIARTVVEHVAQRLPASHRALW